MEYGLPRCIFAKQANIGRAATRNHRYFRCGQNHPLRLFTSYFSLGTSAVSRESVTSLSTRRSSAREDHSRSKPLLWWIDVESNDAEARKQLEQAHPQLHVQFTPTLHEARAYLSDNVQDMKHRRRIVVISRGRYSSESKTVLDVLRLLNEFDVKASVGVYTTDRAGLRKNVPNIPEHVQIFDKRRALLDFVREKLDA